MDAAGNTLWYRTNKIPLKDKNGNVIGILGSSEDITNQLIFETNLIKSENKYSSLFNNNHSTMLIIDPANGNIIDANQAAINFYGWELEELKNMKISQINILTDEEVFEAMEKAKLNNQHFFRFRHRLKNNEVKDVEVFTGPITIGDTHFLYSIIHDVTEKLLN